MILIRMSECISGAADLVWSLEVGEYIAKAQEGIFLDNIARHAIRAVFISWSEIKGHMMVNPKQRKWVIDEMGKRGLAYDDATTKMLQKNAKLAIYERTAMFFLRQQAFKGFGSDEDLVSGRVMQLPRGRLFECPVRKEEISIFIHAGILESRNRDGCLEAALQQMREELVGMQTELADVKMRLSFLPNDVRGFHRRSKGTSKKSNSSRSSAHHAADGHRKRW